MDEREKVTTNRRTDVLVGSQRLYNPLPVCPSLNQSQFGEPGRERNSRVSALLFTFSVYNVESKRDPYPLYGIIIHLFRLQR